MNSIRQLMALAMLLVAGSAFAEHVTCESIDFDYRECRIDTRGDVQLVERHSRSACREGYDWGVRRGRVWVANGCRATFAAYRRDHGYSPGYGGGYQSGGAWQVACESRDYRQAVCAIDTSRGVRLVERLSRSACREGYDWGLTHRGVWVANGCRAIFEAGGYRNDGYRDAWRGGYHPGHNAYCRH